MKWDGQAFVEDIKYGLNLLLTDKDKKNAQIMQHKEFTSYFKSQHIFGREWFSRCNYSIVLTCNSYGVDFDFQKELNNLGDRIISLTWSMAARHIRTWEFEKEQDRIKSECEKTFEITHSDDADEAEKEDKPMAAPKAFNFNNFISENNQVKQIPLDMLVPYHNHKFKLYEGERLNDMVQSVKSNGVIIPIIVRPVDGDDKYEILAGHNRTNAARLAGLKNIPAFVRENLTDEEAEIYVVETNIMQRGFDDLSITERAAVIAARHSAMFDEDKRKAIERELAIMNGEEAEEQEDDTTDEEGKSKKSKLAAVGENYGLSKDSVARLIRIDKLVDELKPYVDNGTVKIRTAVNLSYLSTFEQIKVSEYIENFGMDMKKSEVLREVSKQKQLLNGNAIREIMMYGNLSGSDGEVAATRKPMKVKISTNVCDKYFAPDWDEKKVQEIIEAALERYFNGLENSGDIDRLIMDDEDKYQI